MQVVLPVTMGYLVGYLSVCLEIFVSRLHFYYAQSKEKGNAKDKGLCKC